MVANTEEKILDAALKIFSKKGYGGARTRIIARESGFTEMTLFRKFESKENLFNQVLIKNQERLMRDFDSLVISDENEPPKKRFSSLIMILMNLMDEHFEYINLLIYEKDRIPNSITDPFILSISNYLDKIFPQPKIDHNLLSFMILSSLYFFIFNKKRENGIFYIENGVEEFIKYHVNCLQL
ncbi:TetR/AcrR family transcriptional regulator [Methanobacterium ferruginis]|jgi:AcrR family transcriptional regulator|uniref:TetR/AcrR family transcriptional regulator n=1 Tax=Methanobacterium ferruginis TaxID=710191 RepID=UPI002573EDFA|nr:TetR/AcrR family transcriptional regulator [Methanobacterium ferruginis]MCC7550838.1 TetR/AcrR family transcriptional regulator [Methanobacterium sp.]BDZ67301.1 TetR family transcriptional regulator [Methanobacterium ferruginis]